MVKIMENPYHLKDDDLGGKLPLFSETPIYSMIFWFKGIDSLIRFHALIGWSWVLDVSNEHKTLVVEVI